MKPRSLMSSLIIAVAAVAGSLELGKGIINTFSFDIFRKCVDGDYTLDAGFCQYGPQLSINALTAIIFILAGLFMAKRLVDYVPKWKTLTILGILLFTLLVIFWRIQISLQDNFTIISGPETLSQYLYVGFIWLDTILAGLIVGLFAWLPGAVDRNAKTRKEPREKFDKKK